MNPYRIARTLRGLIARPSARAYAAAYLSNIFIVAGIVVAFRLAKNHLAAEEFSQYAVLKRFVSFLVPLLCMGVNVAVARQVAYVDKQKTSKAPAAFLISALLITFAVIAVVMAVAFVAPQSIATLTWGRPEFSGLVVAAVPAVGGTLLHIIGYGYLRGRFWLVRASVLDVVNIGLIPIGALLIATTAEQAFLFVGVAMTAVSSGSIALMLAAAHKPRRKQLAGSARSLLRFGVPRVPGEMTLGLLLYLPVMLTAHYSGMESAGHVAYSLSVMTLLQTIVSPLSAVLLPQATIMLRAGEAAKVLRRMVQFVAASGGATATAIVVIVIGTRPLLRLHLGDYSEELVAVVRLVTIGGLPFNVFVCLRSIADASTERTINARSAYAAMAASLAFFGMERMLFPTDFGPLFALHVGLLTLALATVFQTVHAIRSIGADARPDTRRWASKRAA